MIATFDTDVPAAPAPKTSWTLEEYAARPEELFYHELVDGQLVEKPMSDISLLVINNLSKVMIPWVLRTGAGEFFGETPSRYLPRRPRTVRIPDGAFISRARIDAYQWGNAFLELAPDLAVEIISPSDIFYDVDRKLAEFFEAGVRRAWVINPDVPSVRVHRSFEDVIILRPGDELVDEEVLPGFRCPVDALFVRPGTAARPPV